MAKSHHFSPSNLSGDSGLTLSDSQLYDEDGNGNELVYDRRNYSRSMSQYNQRDLNRSTTGASRSLDSQYFYTPFDPQNPVPPPRRGRRKGSDPNQSPNMEYDRKPTRYTSAANFNIPGRYDRRNNSAYNDKFKQKRRSSESLKSVEESSEADSEVNMRNYGRPSDIGTLVKSASGAHLFFEELNSNTVYEFDNLNQNIKRGKLCKQASEGAMPMSPQSKYSLGSSRDSVLSDSSGSYLNRQNSPDPLSSSADTPDTEERGMSQWLSQQSEQVSFSQKSDRQFSQDDSELGMKRDRKVSNKMDYLVSPKTSPTLRRRSPIPVSSRHSFPIEFDASPVGSGSNTSKEAEDIIKSPKLTITYSSQDGLDRNFDSPGKGYNRSRPLLDIYNNNTQMAQKQLNIYSSGLQGTSPPPRVVLQGLSQAQTQKRDNGPVKGNHEIMNHMTKGSADPGESRKPYLMQESSVSSEEDLGGADSEPEMHMYRVTTIVNIPLDVKVSKQIPNESSNLLSSSDSLSSKSLSSDELSTPSRPNNPPCYEEALQRNYLLKSGLSPDMAEEDPETLRQRQASLRAKQLYEQSMKQYNDRDVYRLPSQRFEKLLTVVGEKGEKNFIEEDSSDISSSDDESVENNPRKLYEESLQKYMAEQTRDQPVSSLAKSSSVDDNFSISTNKENRQVSRVSSGLHRSQSDVGDQPDPRTPVKVVTGHEGVKSTPTKRPNQPPPYNEPPPYRTDTSPVDKDRHQFAKASGYLGQNKATMNKSDNVSGTVSPSLRSPVNVNTLSRKNILVSNRSNIVNNQVPQTNMQEKQRQIDYSVQSGHSKVNISSSVERNRYLESQRNSQKATVSELSHDVFKNPTSSFDKREQIDKMLSPKVSSHGPISSRNPHTNDLAKSENVQRPGQSERRNSLDAAVSRRSMGNMSKDLPWSVKNLSTIFDKNKVNIVQSSQSPRSTPPLALSTSVRTGGPPPYTPPPPFQRQANTSRSSTSSNSSVGSTGNLHHSQNKKLHKHGPQARDSFSSTDDSECSCQYSLSCPSKDSSSMEEMDNISCTDITYV